MNSITTKPAINSEILFALDKQTQQTRVELGSLLRTLSAPAALFQAAASAWGNKLQIVRDPESGSALYFLPIQLAADFIDLILDQLSSAARADAVRFRDASRSLEASANTISRLKQTKPHVYEAWLKWMDSDEAKQTMHKVLSRQHQRPSASTPNPSAPAGQ